MSLILKYKKYLVGIIIALFLIFSFNWYVGKKEKAAYAQGFQSSNLQWEKKGKEYVGMIDQAYARNRSMNYALNLLSEGKIIEEQKRRTDVNEQQLEYSKNPDSDRTGLDDKFIKLYNDSLGGK